SHTLLLDPEAAGFLRAGLARRSPALLREVRDFTVAEHGRAPLVVRLYEELIWSTVSPSAETDRSVLRHAARVLRAVAGRGVAPAAADDTGRWALHLMPRLPDEVLGREDVRRIQVASCERLGLEPPDLPGLPAGVLAEARALVRRTMTVGVSARSDGIVVSRPPAEGSKIVHAGGSGHKVRIDALSSLTHSAEPVRLELLEGQSVHLPMTVVQRLGPDGEVRMSLSHPGTAVDIAVTAHGATSTGPVHCAVLLADGTIVVHDGGGTEYLRIPPDGAPTARRSVTLAADGSVVTCVEGGAVRHHPLRPDAPAPQPLDEPDALDPPARTTAHFRTPDDDRVIVRAGPDGRIVAFPAADEWSDDVAQWRDLGRAPWQVSSLAVSTDGQWVALVGNDFLLVELPLAPGPARRETVLHFCAQWVFAADDGGWVVAGAGGPVELSTEDGRGYRILPDTGPPSLAGGGPAWGQGCVLVESSPARMEALAELPGVTCLAVDFGHGLDPDRSRIGGLVAAAHRRGTRVAVGLDVSALRVDALDAVRLWLDLEADGLLLIGGGPVEVSALEDVRHLLDGYDDRMLVCASPVPEDRRGLFHVVPAASLISTLGFTIRSRSMAGGAFEQAMSRLRDEVAHCFSARYRTSGHQAFQWGLALPPALSAGPAGLAGAVLLALPGCPVLPGQLLLEDAPEASVLRTLLGLRHNHLAMTHGSCEVLDTGSAHILGVERRHGEERVLCLTNLAQIPATARYRPRDPGTTVRLRDLGDGAVLTSPSDAPLPVGLAAGSARWFSVLTP
ncbi:hypothetical protein, partial [Streptomyces sp. NPDC058964]|uniref:hypothetical protein n=1 Tax=Streptomyces sp. NPDC058964 TaxID=3346681 RepID=UPI0036A39D1B